MTTPADPARPGPPTVREIAELTARLRDISARGRDVDETQRAAFLTDKDALIARITDTTSTADTRGRVTLAVQDAMTEVAHARAVDPGYVLVGPSARTWLRDPTTGRPTAPVSEAEHRAVRELMGREALDTTEPQWVVGDDGHTDIHTTVVPAAAPEDAPEGAPNDAGWPVTLTRAEAATRLTELGYDPASAQAMVAEYLHETSRAVGAPVYQWGLDQNDIDAIDADYRWVDHERGETLAQARERAAEHATGWAVHASTADRERSPGYASHAEGQAAQWAARASTPEPFTHPDPDDDVDSDVGSDDAWIGGDELSIDAEHDAVRESPRTAVPRAEGGEGRTERIQEWQRATVADLDHAGGGSAVIPEQDRREQLARWHAEDQATQDDATGAEQLDGAPFDLSRGDHR